MPVKKKTKLEVLESLSQKERDFHSLNKITFTTNTETITANITVRVNETSKKPPMYLYTLENGFRYISSLYPLKDGGYRFDYQPKGDRVMIYEVGEDGKVVVRDV